MHYHVDCPCGLSVRVAETAAGTTTTCACGRTITVPSLGDLRRLTGRAQSNLAPELVVESLLLAGKLPEEDACVLCGAATLSTVVCRTECERAYMESGQPSWWGYLLAFVTFGWLGVVAVASTAGDDQERGTDRIYPLPLRVCDSCRPTLTTPDEMKEALCRVPVYRRLLRKYRNATVFVESQ